MGLSLHAYSIQLLFWTKRPSTGLLKAPFGKLPRKMDGAQCVSYHGTFLACIHKLLQKRSRPHSVSDCMHTVALLDQTAVNWFIKGTIWKASENKGWITMLFVSWDCACMHIAYSCSSGPSHNYFIKGTIWKASWK